MRFSIDTTPGRRYWMPALGCLALLLFVPACSNQNRKPVFPVHGRVTLEGKPVSKATIMFIPVDASDRSLQPNTMTDADGRFTLTSYVSGDGAPAGEYVVAIVWPGTKTKGKKPEAGEDPESDSAPDQLKGKYWPASASKLRANVKAEPNNEINFNLPESAQGDVR